MTTENYVAKLNEDKCRRGLKVDYQEDGCDGPDHLRTFRIIAVVNGKAYPVGVGKSKKEAKENAARAAWLGLQSVETSPSVRGASPQTLIKPSAEDDTSCDEMSQQKRFSLDSSSPLREKLENLSINSTPDKSSSTEQNFIGALNEYCQKRKLYLDFKHVNRSGPSHCPEFVYEVHIGQTKYPQGVGKSVKEAKKNAAQQALVLLQQQRLQDSVELTDSVDDALGSSFSNWDTSGASSANGGSETSDSVVFKDSPNKQVPGPSGKPKVKLAPNFLNAPKSKENLVNFKEDNQISSPAKRTSNSHEKSRFTEDFDTIKPLGKGGFGSVFSASRKLDKKKYAVKIVRCNKKALREVKALSDLHHPNIVRYHTAWTENFRFVHDEKADDSCSSESNSDSPGSYIYIQMELCGGTLREWIDKQNTNPDPQRQEKSLHIMKQIIEGVEYIHSKKLIHRDMKPLNIMFGYDNVVKIGDFGLATDESDDQNTIERTQKTGTRSYMAPEQKRKDYNSKVDIFALGLIYFELLCPFGTQFEKCEKWFEGGVRNRVFPPDFQEKYHSEFCVIRLLLSEKPEDRPDAAVVKAELEKLSWSLQSLRSMKPHSV